MEVEVKYKKCKTCKFFLQHYIKRHTKFLGIDCGHCVSPQLNGKWTRNKYALRADCEFWESDEENKFERREKIKEVLKDIEERLND